MLIFFGGEVVFEVGTLNNKWIKIKDQEMLDRFYEANCLFQDSTQKRKTFT